MSIAESSVEKITTKIYENAVKLAEVKNYKEKQPTMPYHLCDTIMVDHTKKAFWFTNEETAEHTLSIKH